MDAPKAEADANSRSGVLRGPLYADQGQWPGACLRGRPDPRAGHGDSPSGMPDNLLQRRHGFACLIRLEEEAHYGMIVKFLCSMSVPCLIGILSSASVHLCYYM